MKKETRSNVKSDVATGMSSAVGATAGMVAGSVLANEVNAAEPEENPAVESESDDKYSRPAHGASHASTHATTGDPTPAPESASNPAPEPQAVPDTEWISDHESVPAPEPQPETEQQPNPELQPTAEPMSEPEVTVLSYETVTADDGSMFDVAVVDIDGLETIVADVDRDGEADIIAADLDNNGVIDCQEMIDVTGEGIMMPTLQEAAMQPDPNDDTLLAQNGDYVNDADVTEYMA